MEDITRHREDVKPPIRAGWAIFDVLSFPLPPPRSTAVQSLLPLERTMREAAALRRPTQRKRKTAFFSAKRQAVRGETQSVSNGKCSKKTAAPSGTAVDARGRKGRVRPYLRSESYCGQPRFHPDAARAGSAARRPAFRDAPCPRPRCRAGRPRIRPAFPCFRFPWVRP